MIFEILKSIVQRRVREAFEHVRLYVRPAPHAVVFVHVECEPRDDLSSGAAMSRVRCKLDSKLANRVGRVMARPDMRRCRRCRR